MPSSRILAASLIFATSCRTGAARPTETETITAELAAASAQAADEPPPADVSGCGMAGSGDVEARARRLRRAVLTRTCDPSALSDLFELLGREPDEEPELRYLLRQDRPDPLLVRGLVLASLARGSRPSGDPDESESENPCEAAAVLEGHGRVLAAAEVYLEELSANESDAACIDGLERLEAALEALAAARALQATQGSWADARSIEPLAFHGALMQVISLRPRFRDWLHPEIGVFVAHDPAEIAVVTHLRDDDLEPWGSFAPSELEQALRQSGAGAARRFDARTVFSPWVTASEGLAYDSPWYWLASPDRLSSPGYPLDLATLQRAVNATTHAVTVDDWVLGFGLIRNVWYLLVIDAYDGDHSG